MLHINHPRLQEEAQTGAKTEQQKKKIMKDGRGWGLGETGTKLPMSGYRVTCWGLGNSFPIKDKFEDTGCVHCNYPTQSRL